MNSMFVSPCCLLILTKLRQNETYSSGDSVAQRVITAMKAILTILMEHFKFFLHEYSC